MLFELEWLLERFLNVEEFNKIEHKIDIVTTDSRETQKNGLFIPLNGEQFDAHDFAEEAIENGAVALLWDSAKNIPNHLKERALFIKVEDTLVALQKIAGLYREKINPVVVGITGSNGKTTTKDIVTSVLKTSYKTHKTAGNYNNHIGLPLTILAMPKNTEILVLEMGMSHYDEISLLSKLAKPDYAIVTNIGESHIEHLGSRVGIAKAKLEILEGLDSTGVFIYDGDEILLKEYDSEINSEIEHISCGFEESPVFKIDVTYISSTHTYFKLNKNESFHIPLHGKHHAKNATYAVALAKRLNISNEKVQLGFDALQITEMRFQWLNGKNGVTIIDDAYNASPTSMKAAIEVVKELSSFESKILVLGDIYELGSHSDELHRSVASVIDSPIDVLFTYGEAAHLISQEVLKAAKPIKLKHFETIEELIEELQHYLIKENLIFFKASRGMHFEKIIKHV